MEIKTCEEYVLGELENAQNKIEELSDLLNNKELEIQALENQLDEHLYRIYNCDYKLDNTTKEMDALKDKVSFINTAYDDLTDVYEYYMYKIGQVIKQFDLIRDDDGAVIGYQFNGDSKLCPVLDELERAIKDFELEDDE